MSTWVRFTSAGGEPGFGTLEAGHIAEYRGELFAEPVATGRTHAASQVRLGSPCTPTKLIALWNNFRALAEKLGKPAPTYPLFALKPGTSVIGTGETIRRPPRYAGKIIFEGELGVVIGRTCSNVAVADARQYIFGYTCVNDVTAVELINESPDFPQWCRSKGFDTFSCLGPAIATVLDWTSARVVTTLDAVERQNYPLPDMIIPPEELVSRISGDMTLYPGDVIACGTSIGAGSMKDGATVCISITGIGELRNTIAA